MPKTISEFDAQLSVMCPQDLKDSLIAMGYFEGQGKKYASIARKLLSAGISRMVSAMDEADRARYNEILDNIRLARSASLNALIGTE